MLGNWIDNNTLYTEMHLREMRAAADEARRARQAYRPRRLRRRMGRLLINAGERLAQP